jgi:CheY-like chemotaxis protein
MGKGERGYRLTRAGREAWEGEDTAVPADYRRLLWLMDFHGHAGVVQGLLRHYPRDVLDEWLSEMAELGLIEPIPEGGSELLDATPTRLPDTTMALGKLDLQKAQAAGAALSRTGAYLSADRLAQRRPPRKAPGETVVLIVEDDPDQLALADLRLTMAGYQVRVASSLKAFLQAMLDDGAPDLLLLDIELPDGNGFDILSRLRRHRELFALPIVMLTARNTPEDIGRGLVLGADGYITKPYTKKILAEVIRQVMKQDPQAL